ncbi:energy-coupled thiamine transporter ThiT [Bacillus sp. JJ1521]|uniref:energy-coupled thiamine transporter ThiT n=1 Tax=Bacillus sp. JJ1521 TaxID=3122957 RepID=UPI002FFE3E45
MRNTRLQAMIEAAIFAVLALALDIFVPSIKIATISISFAMVPIFIIALRWGFKTGFLSGLIWGLLQLVFDPQIIHPLQGFIEFVIAFPFIGFAGLLKNPVQRTLINNKKGLAIGIIVIAIFIGSVARYFWHFLAGFIYWGMYAPKGMDPVFYSFTFNSIAMLGSFIACSIVLILLIVASPRFFIQKETM